MSGSVRSKSWFSWLPTLRFRAKISLGFALVLLISAVSLGTAYFRFEGVSKAVASYRNSVAEADLARNIDRELISYRLLVKYYVVTAKEEDAKAAQAAETSLKDAIDKSLAGTKTPARREGLNKLATEFRNFAATFAEIVKVKGESALLVQNQLQSNANMLKYKLDDILSNASESEQQAIESGTKRVQTQFAAASAACTSGNVLHSLRNGSVSSTALAAANSGSAATRRAIAAAAAARRSAGIASRRARTSRRSTAFASRNAAPCGASAARPGAD